MKRRIVATAGAIAILAGAGAGVAQAAGYGPPVPGWGNRADCPYATSDTPLRIHAQDGTGANARPDAPLQLLDGSGPHGPWAAGR